MRAKNLQKGIRTLIGEDHAARLYGHPLVSTLAKEKRLSSYIGSGTFASVLVDLLAHDENGKPAVAGKDQAPALVDRVGDDAVLGPALRALSHAGAETVADLRREIAAWCDEGMNRVSGWYRRQTQAIILVIGAVVAVSANASTFHVVRDLWQDDALRYAVAQQAVTGNILESFPLGWECEGPWGREDGLPDWGAEGWIAHALGWLFTAAAVSLGAPFWFDLLSRVARLRGTGRPGVGVGGRSISDRELMPMHVEALFTHDAEGRMRTVNEPGGGKAPRFFFGRDGRGQRVAVSA